MTDVVVFYKRATASVDKGRATDDLSGPCKAFDMVHYNILLAKLERDGFEGCTVQRIRNWLDGHIQRGMVNGSEFRWTSVTSDALRVHIGTTVN